MKHDRHDVAEGRAETDASLGKERATADDAISRSQAKAAQQLDALIARDRVLADDGVMRFRQGADELLASRRSAAPEPSSQLVRERLAADDRQEAERSVTDGVLEHERRRADARGERSRDGLALAHDVQRHNTDALLSDERTDADLVANERDATADALDNARTAEANRADVFAMVTHDLRNPLCAIVANADVIAEAAGSSHTREAAEDIRHAAARMGRLLTDLSDVVRIDAGMFELDQRPHDVRALLSEMRREFRPLFDDRGVTLSVDVPPTDVVASFDHDRVVQMLSNLLGNALKFTAPGRTVDLHVEHDQDQLEFVVRDEGAGIHPSALPYLFDRFWQQGPDMRRGLGLGLYICRIIARAHGGDISVRSEVGAGSTFRVWLPMS